MNISLFGNLNGNSILPIAESAARILYNSGCSVFVSDDFTSLLSDLPVSFLPESRLMEVCDAALVIGGDGSTVKAAKNAAICGKSILGINAGRLGFLSGIEKNELSLLENLARGNYKIDERIMLKAQIVENSSVKETYHCLNDAVFSRGDFSRLIDINITSEGRALLDLRADGVIVSTPTGSTAYSLAAGGPVLSPDLNCFVITAICPHSLMDRSIVVSSSSTLCVELKSDINNHSVLTCDGEDAVKITADSKITVSLSQYKARLIRLKPDNFYEVMKKKIIERRS